MNTVQKSSIRDRRVLRYLDLLGILTTEQVRLLCFSNIKTGDRKAQQRLKRLYDVGLVKRMRPSLDSPMAYWTHTKPAQIEHSIASNWVYCYLQAKCQAWQKVTGWYPEEDMGILRCDALAQVKNTVTSKSVFYFIEVDLSDNRFDKVQKYTALCRRGIRSWWVDETEVFPKVFVATYDKARLLQIQGTIRKENVLKLQFDVMLLEDVKSGALSWSMKA